MNLKVIFFAMAVILMANFPVWADVLELKDGTLIKGTLVSRDAQTIKFRTQYSEGAYPVAAVKNLTLAGFGAPAPATPPPVQAAPAPKASNKIKAGSIVSVKLLQALSSKMPTGSSFNGVLAYALAAGNTRIPAGTPVSGVVSSSAVGRSCHIAITITQVVVLGKAVPLQTQGVRFSGSAQPGAVQTTARAATVGGLFSGRSGARDGAKVGGAIAILRGPKVTQVPNGKVFNVTLLRDVVVP